MRPFDRNPFAVLARLSKVALVVSGKSQNPANCLYLGAIMKNKPLRKNLISDQRDLFAGETDSGQYYLIYIHFDSFTNKTI